MNLIIALALFSLAQTPPSPFGDAPVQALPNSTLAMGVYSAWTPPHAEKGMAIGMYHTTLFFGTDDGWEWGFKNFLLPACYSLGYAAGIMRDDSSGDSDVFLVLGLTGVTLAALIPEPYLKIPLHIDRSTGSFWTIIADLGIQGGLVLAYASMGRLVDWHLQAGVGLLDFALSWKEFGTLLDDAVVIPAGITMTGAMTFHVSSALELSLLAKETIGVFTDDSLTHILASVRYISGTSFMEASAGTSAYRGSGTRDFTAPVFNLRAGWNF